MEICFWEGSGAAHFLQNRESVVLSVLHSGHLILTVPLCYLPKDYQFMRRESNMENVWKRGQAPFLCHCELAWQSHTEKRGLTLFVVVARSAATRQFHHYARNDIIKTLPNY
jgi:hypothetical protein